MAHLETLAFQFGGQGPCALASPPQRRHRIASCLGLDQTFYRADQLGLLLFPCPTTGTRSSLAIPGKRIRGLKFPNPIAYGAIRDSCRFRDGSDSTPPQGHSFGRSPSAASPFVKFGDERNVLATNPFDNSRFRHLGSIA